MKSIKFKNEAKGFGFIKDEETGTDFFVHTTGLNDQIEEGDLVSFDLADGKKGYQETNYRK
jgi:CspA family cold shock protein